MRLIKLDSNTIKAKKKQWYITAKKQSLLIWKPSQLLFVSEVRTAEWQFRLHGLQWEQGKSCEGSVGTGKFQNGAEVELVKGKKADGQQKDRKKQLSS